MKEGQKSVQIETPLIIVQPNHPIDYGRTWLTHNIDETIILTQTLFFNLQGHAKMRHL